MKIDFTNDGMRIVPEDVRDELFLKNVLEIEKGKVFCKVSEYEGKWENGKMIEIMAFDESFKNNFKHDGRKFGHHDRRDDRRDEKGDEYRTS